MSEFAQYIGLEWEAGADGPHAYDCWHFLRHVLREHFGKELPLIPLGDHEGVTAIMKASLHARQIIPLDQAEHGAAILLRGDGEPHVGLWLDIDGGGVLHSMRGHGVIYSHKHRLATMGFTNIKYYRVAK